MAIARIYNGYGQYEERDGELGICLTYAGVNFWLPYGRVTTIPDYVLRELNHEKSTPKEGEVGELVYENVMVRGDRLVEELLDKQIPIPVAQMGVIKIKGKPTGRSIEVKAGINAEGQRLSSEVAEHEATPSEVATAERLAKEYKERIVAEYFQGKRERMTGGRGNLHPSPIVRTYMAELNIEDMDDVTAHAKNSGIDPELIKQLMSAVAHESAKTNQDNIIALLDAVKEAGARKNPKSLGLADKKAEYDAAHPETVKLSTS